MKTQIVLLVGFEEYEYQPYKIHVVHTELCSFHDMAISSRLLVYIVYDERKVHKKLHFHKSCFM